jgi:pyridoxal phosphate enzyme (YggS family)
MASICENLQTIGQQIKTAEIRYGRELGSVKLLAVSKRHPAETITTAMQCGQVAFGENYAQEMQEKADALINNNINWHFIGPIQSNKTKPIAEMASWVHTVERLKIAKRLSEQRPEGLPPINICLQVNISGEASKAGVAPDELPALAEQIIELPNLSLRGLMVIPAPENQFDEQRRVFAKVKTLLENLQAKGYPLDTLSMGMSGDMEAAIAEGATIVRIGTAIFGERL